MQTLKATGILVTLWFLLIGSPGGVAAASGDGLPGSEELSELKTYTPEQLNAALATLSDKEVREALLAELMREAEAARPEDQERSQTGIAGIIAYHEKVIGTAPQRIKTLLAGLGKLPDDIGKYIDEVTGGKGGGRFFLLLLGVAAIMGAGLGLERLLMGPILKRGNTLTDATFTGDFARFGGALMAALPALIGILLFAVAAGLLCIIILGTGLPMRHLYIPILKAIVGIRLLMLGAKVLCAPQDRELRLLRMDDASAAHLNRLLNLFVWGYMVVRITTQWFVRVGIPADHFLLVTLTLGSSMLLMLGGFVWVNRTRVAHHITGEADIEKEPPSRLAPQFASVWHLLALAYLFWIWYAMVSRMIVYGPNFGQAFIRSLLVIPLFLLFDRILEWLLPALLGTPSAEVQTTVSQGNESPANETASGQDEDKPRDPVRTLRSKMPLVRGLARTTIALVLLVWLLEAYNIRLPYIAKVAGGGFDILVTLVLALAAWRGLNSYVTQKLLETTPKPTEEKSDDDEFGSGVILDRSHTLLPMLRKFIGTVLLVMVVLIVLSSIGINIGPLLAGAGVIGLAVGFGAQKLVSDVLSGFFFLMDDAFRVGEYIQAGSVSGTVEAITLRNVMMRHHRGALQIVPFSDLGTITNHMRGGMVVKSNLDLPYDTDIEKVRKIIKKVGKKMMADPEMAENFIQPVKSQGVKKVGDSVMTFRYKFTAKPGKQFVIKREAFRRIKEALEAKGIFLAYRKVIVELPEGQAPASQASDPHDQLLKAGAAAGLETIIAHEKSDASKKK
ncbi:MAG: mechanosensitive ion channel domain-containing protein [Desulfobacterales bacterium]